MHACNLKNVAIFRWGVSNLMNAKNFNNKARGLAVRRTALALAVAAGFGMTGQVLAQATTGSVFGTAPVSAGETVRIVNNQTGLSREVAVGTDGRYSVSKLPVGDYTVSLMQNGNVVSSHQHVQVSVAGGSAVTFAAAAKSVQNLSSVTVTANSLPAIDVSSTRQTSVITAQQLKVLPIAHDAEDIALLAPGVSFGASTLGNGPTGTPLVSMGGNSVVENAYYLNGFNTTDPIGGAGGISLPYFAIAEQQTITSGYGPEYGRSTGGVISQIGKRGSNEFHAGVYASWQPSWAQGNFQNVHYNNPLTPVGAVNNGFQPNGTFGPGQPYLATSQGTTAYPAGYGQIMQGKKQNSNWQTTYDAYISGPLIKDKLFFYITAEWQHDSAQGGLRNFGITSPSGYWQSTSYSDPKIYAKLDWNINDNNVLEFTGVQTKNNENGSNFYNYDYTNQKVGSYYGPGILSQNSFKIGVLKWTSYITDNLSLEAQYGVMKAQYDNSLAGGVQSPVTFGSGVTIPAGVSVPALLDTTTGNPGHNTKTANLRIDLDWKITDNHDLKFGIDNLQYRDNNEGSDILNGSSYNYVYGSPSVFAASTPFIGNPGLGNYVVQNFVRQDTSLQTQERAQYIEDKWQVTPNLLLDLGLRNDQFTNLAHGIPYVRETSPQWAPRLGFSWDVFGDSTFKVYGNAGRYYLALPAALAARNPAEASINGSVVYTYTGISPNGVPTGLTVVPVALAPGVTMPGFFSSDGENGIPGNIKDYASTNLRPQYQDEYVLGFQKTLGNTGLVYGSQATYQRAGNLVDDTDLNSPYCAAGLVNPGKTNYIPCAAAPGGVVVWNPNNGQGVYTAGQPFIPFPKPSRKYYALDTFLEHSWDGKWFGKIDYMFAKSYGSSEGPTNTAIGQITNQTNGGFSGSTTATWDFPDIMAYANGEQANSHRHTIKAFGAYAITPEWLVSGTFIMQSGVPNQCLSGFGPTIYADAYNGPYQHYCGGVPSGISTQVVTVGGVPTTVGYGGVGSPGGTSGHTPWTHQLNLSLTYTPEWANKHLTLQWEVHNVFNEQKATLYYTAYAVGAGGGPLSTTPARTCTTRSTIPLRRRRCRAI
jgi:hypothetical protein